MPTPGVIYGCRVFDQVKVGVCEGGEAEELALSALVTFVPEHEEEVACYMDESREAIERGRGISLERMLEACSRHYASSISVSKRGACLYSQWYCSDRGHRIKSEMNCMASCFVPR